VNGTTLVVTPKGGSTLSEKLRKYLALALALALVVTMFGIVGCGGEEEPEEEPKSDVQKGGTMKFRLGDVAFIDPINLQESEGTQVGSVVFDSLTAFDPLTSELLPAAAESWEANDDASVWTFKLVQGAKFHNGREVTAEDFKYSWERICNPDNGSEIAYHLEPIKGYQAMQDKTATELEGVKVIDDYTLEVTLEYGFGDFEYVVGHPAFAPVPKEEVEKDVEAFGLMPIGNGPFKMVEPWVADQYIKVEKFADYYGDEPNIDAIDFTIISDGDTAWLEFQAGNLDFTDIPTGQIDSSVAEWGESPDGYTMNPGEQVVLGAESSIYYYLINNTIAPFKDNVKLRQALSMAIDRQEICDKVYEGVRVPATGMVPPGIAGYVEDQWPEATYDVEGAKALLAEAGFPNGEGLPPITIDYNTGSNHDQPALLIQEDWKAIGINAELRGTEWAAYLDKLDAKDYQIGRLGWIADYPIMDNFLYPLFQSEAANNSSGFNDPEIDAALLDARSTPVTEERLAKYAEIEKTIGESAPVIPIVFYRHAQIGSDRVNDGVYSVFGLFSFETVWLTQE